MDLHSAETALKQLHEFLISPVYLLFDQEMELDTAEYDNALDEKPDSIAAIIEREQILGERRRHKRSSGYFLALYDELTELVRIKKEEQ